MPDVLTLKEIKKDLTGWQLATCYTLELKHTLMGYFPLIDTSLKKIVICLSKEDLKTVWEKVPKRYCRINEVICLVSIDKGITFPINSPKGDEITSEDTFFAFGDKLQEALTKNEFNWASGLLDINQPDESASIFPE